MKYSDQVKLSIAQYPTLYPGRAAVADHLFFVIGNGFEWAADGTLQTHEQESGDMAALADIEHYVATGQHKDSILKHSKHARTIPDDIEDRVNTLGRTHWYEISQYSRIEHIPDNVQPDWLDAIWEAVNLYADSTFEQHGMSSFRNDERMAAHKRYESSVKRAKELVVEIRTRFADHEFKPVVIEPFQRDRKRPEVCMKSWPLNPTELVPMAEVLDPFVDVMEFCYKMERKPGTFKGVGLMEGHIDGRKNPLKEIIRLLALMGIELGRRETRKDEAQSIRFIDAPYDHEMLILIAALPDDGPGKKMKARLKALQQRGDMSDMIQGFGKTSYKGSDWVGFVDDPEGRDYFVFGRAIDTAIQNVKAAYKLRRINEKKDVPYTGYDIPSGMKAGSISPDSRLQAESLRYDKEDQGRSAVEVILGLVIGVASALGERLMLADVADLIASQPLDLTKEEFIYLGSFTPVEDNPEIKEVQLRMDDHQYPVMERIRRAEARLTPEQKQARAEIARQILNELTERTKPKEPVEPSPEATELIGIIKDVGKKLVKTTS